MPLAAGVRGILLSMVRRQPKWIPYFLCYTWFNYTAMVGALLGGRRRARRDAPDTDRAPERSEERSSRGADRHTGRGTRHGASTLEGP
jgi:hypothetical protein